MFDKLKKSIFNWKFLLGAVLAAFCAFVHIPQYFEVYFPALTPSPYVWWGLDLSWMLTLSYTNINEWVWGTDFAFTYGPLSYLSTRLAWGTNGTSLFLFDIFFFINMFLLCFLSFKKSGNKVITAALIIAYTLLLPGYLGPAVPLIMLSFLVFWIRQSIDEPKYVYYIFQIILLYLLFFIKFNTGLIAFPLFYLGLLYNIISKNGKLYLLLLYAIVPVILIIISCPYLHVDLMAYIKTAMEIVSGYNDLMYLDHDDDIRGAALFILFSPVLILILKLIVERKTDLKKNLVVLVIYGIPIFVLYKQGFVRGVEYFFFVFSILSILAVQDLHFGNFKRYWYSSLIIIAIIYCSFNVVFFAKEPLATFETETKTEKHYLEGMKNFSSTSGLHIYTDSNQLPASVKEKVGNNSVDIYPWNSQLLLENKLKFRPRPVFQSYTAYTKNLEELNFNHYNDSSKAPEFVFYEYLAIDNRYPLFDEPKVNLCILKNYTPVETFDFQERKFILFQKRKDFKPIKLEKSNEYAMVMGAPLVPKKDVYYEIGVYHSFKGSIMSVIDHGPTINLEVNAEGSGVVQFRTGKKLLETGLFLDKNIKNTEDFYALYTNESANKLGIIRCYRFNPLDPSMYKEKIRITEYKITQ